MGPAGRWRLLFAGCGALVLLSLAGATQSVVKAARRAAEAQATALTEARLREAGARMDALVHRFLQVEQARQPGHYQAFRPVAGRLEPSPMLIQEDLLVRLRFQVEGDQVSSPQVPAPSRQPLLQRLGVPDSRLQQARTALDAFRRTFPTATLRRRMAEGPGVLVSRQDMDSLRRPWQRLSGLTGPFETNVSNLYAFWEAGELLLMRQVWEGDQETLQGAWLEPRVLQEALLSEVGADFPGLRLAPTESPREDHALGGLPLRLVAPPPGPPAPLARGLRSILIAAWSLALAALAGGLVLLEVAIRFGQRRAAFIAVVTHELRTPITSFRLYTDLLAQGMVSTPGAQAEIHRTLQTEAERLDHLVRNVLSFSRLERSGPLSLETVTCADLVGRILPRLEARATQSQRPLQVAPADLPSAILATDPALVEQILLNLVDNACKYAHPAQDPTLHLSLALERRHLVCSLRDHGPGLTPGLARDLWRPFHRTGVALAGSQPGIGLGLALSRNLARRLGGDLLLDRSRPGEGAVFQLRLPLAP